MADSCPGHLHLWEGWLSPPLGKAGPAAAGQTPSANLAARLFAAEALSSRHPSRAEPFSLAWFLDLEAARHGRHGSWLPRLLEFGKHGGETLLGLDDGLGTDWAVYARNGCEVVGCGPAAERLALARRNFELRGLPGRFLHASPDALPLSSGSIDVACVAGLLSGPAPAAVVEEVYRVLKPGGKVLALARARYDVDFWCRVWLPWRPRQGPGALPSGPTPAFSGRALRRLFAHFADHHIYRRHLRRADVPPLWRWLPLPLLERLLGRVLVLKAFKPVSAARSSASAAA
jgi:SAM-dependent methyltransferase